MILSSFLSSRIRERDDPDLQHTGISQEDVLRFSKRRAELDGHSHQQVAEKMDSILSAMSDHLCADDEHEELVVLDAEEKMKRLLGGITTAQSEIISLELEITNLYAEVAEIMEEINQHTEILRHDLIDALLHIPKELNAKRALFHDLLAARIETALIKLTLTRARAERQLYDHKSESHPNKTVSKCLITACNALQNQETDMKAEESSLNKELQEYEQLLALMSTGGGYQQVIEDWSRVKQETEECKKDLRRLGWTE
ncbi:hypothetical protein BDQ17DRAFT_320896 [Cyathus striatus]|nr:hypothetical protein BDQ17DRAFT_320896 [Cyathus striatus]